VQNNIPGFQIKEGFSGQKVTLKHEANGLIVPKGKKLKGVGASRDLKVLEKTETGATWYPKADTKSRFDGGQTHKVKAGGDQLVEAVAKAAAGDVLELSPGHYLVERFVRIDKPLTIRSAGDDKPTIEFERTALFEILDGGALKLENLSISGASAPDVAGNSLIRTSRYSMLTNYELIVNNCEVKDLDVNHSFNFLTVAKSTFATRIEIHNSNFSNITGAILALDKETDDLGLYNAEYVVITESSFKDIGKALLNIYRGGTDESTFGPHVEIRGADLNSVGKNKRNKSAASVFMLGVQVASIKDNDFMESKPIRVVQTVGDPVTRIEDNRFTRTPAPEILNGTAIVSGNTVTESGSH
jgi:poly(beta-D-mannuronate) lyase